MRSWLRLENRPGSKIMIDTAKVECVQQLKQGCKVFFVSGNSIKLTDRYDYVADLIHSRVEFEEMKFDDWPDDDEEEAEDAQGT